LAAHSTVAIAEPTVPRTALASGPLLSLPVAVGGAFDHYGQPSSTISDPTRAHRDRFDLGRWSAQTACTAGRESARGRGATAAGAQLLSQLALGGAFDGRGQPSRMPLPSDPRYTRRDHGILCPGGRRILTPEMGLTPHLASVTEQEIAPLGARLGVTARQASGSWSEALA
jgi:hypothetical protein